jgi:uncharacterized phage infection (PIP) family protein YhgE
VPTCPKSICLFVANQNFQASTEHMVNGLYNSSRTALATLQAVQGSVTQHTSKLDSLGASAARLGEQQEQLKASVSQGLQELQQLRQQGRQLEEQLGRSLEMEQQLQGMQERAAMDMQVGTGGLVSKGGGARAGCPANSTPGNSLPREVWSCRLQGGPTHHLTR